MAKAERPPAALLLHPTSGLPLLLEPTSVALLSPVPAWGPPLPLLHGGTSCLPACWCTGRSSNNHWSCGHHGGLLVTRRSSQGLGARLSSGPAPENNGNYGDLRVTRGGGAPAGHPCLLDGGLRSTGGQVTAAGGRRQLLRLATFSAISTTARTNSFCQFSQYSPILKSDGWVPINHCMYLGSADLMLAGPFCHEACV